ncbi:MAG: glycosyl transferase [Flavobacteriales bacterium]|nr:glycosyl transferase [Flavobacteriales bacterium]
MKLLYAIQGTGNGHVSRAIELIPYFKEQADVDILISGIQSDLSLPFEVKYAYKGMSFVFGKKGGIDLLNTYMKNHIHRFISEVRSLPVEEYDLIINDFEPISAWAAYFKGLPAVALSNQAATEFPNMKTSINDDIVGKFILNHYAPTTSQYGFHYKPYAPHIFTPIIRKEIRELKTSEEGHITVYLPAYSEEKIIKKLSLIPNTQFQVFSKHSKLEFHEKNIHVRPIAHETFLKSLASCSGLITAAGFGATSEALFLGKKLLVIPQKQQYEQLCNAEALKKLGVKVVKHLRKKHIPKIQNWIESGKAIKMDYPNQSREIVQTIINNEFLQKDNYLEYLTAQQFDLAN